MVDDLFWSLLGPPPGGPIGSGHGRQRLEHGYHLVLRHLLGRSSRTAPQWSDRVRAWTRPRRWTPSLPPSSSSAAPGNHDGNPRSGFVKKGHTCIYLLLSFFLSFFLSLDLFLFVLFFHASGPSHAQRPPARPPEGGGMGAAPPTMPESCTSPWWCRSTTTAAVERVSISLKGRVPEGWPSKVLHAVACPPAVLD